MCKKEIASERLTIRLTPSMKKTIEEESAKLGVKPGTYVAMLVKFDLDKKSILEMMKNE